MPIASPDIGLVTVVSMSPTPLPLIPLNALPMRSRPSKNKYRREHRTMKFMPQRAGNGNGPTIRSYMLGFVSESEAAEGDPEVPLLSTFAITGRRP